MSSIENIDNLLENTIISNSNTPNLNGSIKAIDLSNEKTKVKVSALCNDSNKKQVPDEFKYQFGMDHSFGKLRESQLNPNSPTVPGLYLNSDYNEQETLKVPTRKKPKFMHSNSYEIEIPKSIKIQDSGRNISV